MDSGHEVHIPPACGYVHEDVSVEAIQEGRVEVELIDGNHTHMAMLQLRDKYPSESAFQER